MRIDRKPSGTLPARRRYKKVVVFYSGKRELTDLTKELLHNRTVAARRDLEQEDGDMIMGM